MTGLGCEEVWCTRDLSLLSMGHTDVAFASYLRIAGLGDGAITVARVEALLSPAHWEVWRLNAVVLHRGQGNGIARSRVP